MDCVIHKTNMVSPLSFNLTIKDIMSSAKPSQYALVSLDFDNFNFINDLFGYSVGDEALRTLEKHFSSKLNDDEFFTRLHADHFVFWVKADTVKQLIIKRFVEIANVSEKLLTVINLGYNFVCSGGIVVIDDLNFVLPAIIDKANFARKQAKGNHTSTFLIYDEKMSSDLNWRKTITFTMEKALNSGEFKMYLQPKILIKTNEIIGAEALVRWISKEHGMICPDNFIPVLEQNGYIEKIDFCMLEQACVYINKCISEKRQALPISVNFSRTHVRNKNFVEQILEIVKAHEVSTSLIEIEITENVMLIDYQELINISKKLKHLGFKVALDDFGCAYSSLNFLKDLPLDVIKIDKAFLNVSENTDRGRVIIAKMVELIKSLGLVSGMEGIETQEQVDFLKKIDCNIGQGYFYAKPMPVEQYEQFIAEHLAICKVEPACTAVPVSATDEINEPKYNEDEYKKRISELEHLVLTQRQNRDALHLSEEMYRVIVEQSDDIVFEWEFASDKVTVSDKFEQLFKYTPQSQNISTSVDVLNTIHPDDRLVFNKWRTDTFGKTGANTVELRIIASDNTYIWTRIRTMGICNKDNKPIKAIGVFTNINSQMHELMNLKHKSQVDPLTGLLNKEETKLYVKEYLKKNPNGSGAFLMIDIDDFKSINDNLGHQFGDTVLKDIAAKIKISVGENDIVGRVGGDEFAVFICNSKSEKDVSACAQKIISNMRHTYFGSNKRYNLSGSIGIAFYPSHGKTYDELYHNADTALYRSKNQGKDIFTIFSQKLVDKATNMLTKHDDSRRFLSAYFNDDPIYNVFEILYETKDIKTSINFVLDILGNKFNVDRVYIFEHSDDLKYTSNTYEWCGNGVSSQMDNLQNLDVNIFSGLFSSFDSEGLIIGNDISAYDAATQDSLERQGVKTFLHCAIMNGGVVKGFVGFDLCKDARNWKGDEIATIAFISRVLSVFLNKTKIQRDLEKSYENHVSMLDNLRGFVYVVNVETYDMLYVNKATKQFGLAVGQKCYEGAFKVNTPCKNCPVKRLNERNTHAHELIYSEHLNVTVHSAASSLKWNGIENAALVCCTDIADYAMYT